MLHRFNDLSVDINLKSRYLINTYVFYDIMISISMLLLLNCLDYYYHFYKLGVKIIAPFFKWLYSKDDSIFCIYLFWIWKYSQLALNWHKIRFLPIFFRVAIDLQRRTPTIFDFRILTLLWPRIKFWVFVWFSWF